MTKAAEGNARKQRVTQQTGIQDIRSFFVFGQSTWTSKAAEVREDTHSAHAQQTTIKRHKTQGESAKALPMLKGLCWNVRGLTTVLQELTQLVEEHNPDFVVLTETKLRKGSTYRRRLTEALEDYVVHTSCKRDILNMREGERTGAAGVAIAIHKKLTAHDSLKVLPLNHPAASGHCQKPLQQQEVMLSTYGLSTCLMTWMSDVKCTRCWKATRCTAKTSSQETGMQHIWQQTDPLESCRNLQTTSMHRCYKDCT